MYSTYRCQYCKQLVILGEELETEEEALLKAKEICTCDGAKLFQKRQVRIEKACDNIELEFHEHFPETEELLKAAVPHIIGYRINKITIDTGNGIKGTVSITSKGSIKVTKAISKKVEHDE